MLTLFTIFKQKFIQKVMLFRRIGNKINPLNEQTEIFYYCSYLDEEREEELVVDPILLFLIKNET